MVADTDGQMICNLAVGIAATKAWTWVNAVKVSALLVCRTVCVDDTFWSARHIGVSKVVGDAPTGSGSSLLAADCVVTAW